MREGLGPRLGLQLQHAPRAPRAWNARRTQPALHSREAREAPESTHAEKAQDVRDQCSPYGLSLAVAAFNPALAVGFDRGVHLLTAACVTKN